EIGEQEGEYSKPSKIKTKGKIPTNIKVAEEQEKKYKLELNHQH
ncbi:6873_t:CDS:2, partial [Gigaspora rosea]